MSNNPYAALECFWIDIDLHNPLNVAVTLTDLTLVVENDLCKAGLKCDIEVEVIDEVYLNAKERRTVSEFEFEFEFDNCFKC